MANRNQNAGRYFSIIAFGEILWFTFMAISLWWRGLIVILIISLCVGTIVGATLAIYYRRKEKQMPVAVVVNTQSDKIDLKSLPGGYVIVRRMNYGEELTRSAMGTKLIVGGTAGKDMSGELDIQTDKIAIWDFAHLVVEHNLTDANDRPLNFKSEADVRMLSGAIGKEIGELIDSFNSAETSDEVKNS